MASDPVKLLRLDKNTVLLCLKQGQLFSVSLSQEKDVVQIFDTQGDAVADAIAISEHVVLLTEANNLIILKYADTQ